MPGYDSAYRRRAVRKGRERGCWVYIPAEELHAAGIGPGLPPPHYRLWSQEKVVLVRFYREA
jgi:hypothetical protein